MIKQKIVAWKHKRKLKKLIKDLTCALFEQHWPKYREVGLTKDRLLEDIATHICDVLNENESEDYIWTVERC